MLAGVPVVAAVAALVSLRRVQISPLGVVRRATPRPPSFWRLIALVIGVGVYVYGLDKTSRNTIGVAAYPGLLLTMIGIVIAGPGSPRRRHGSSAASPAGSVGAAGGPAARRQPETCLPGGDRPHAGGLPRHDGRPDRARGELDRPDPHRRGAQQHPRRPGRAASGGRPAPHRRGQRHPRCRRLPAVQPADTRGGGAGPHTGRRQLRGPARDTSARTSAPRECGPCR